MRIVVISGGVGGARFLRGLTDLAAEGRDLDVTAVVNIADDITIAGLRVCPDLDTVMYTLGGGIDEDRGWGRSGDTFLTQAELLAHDAMPEWFGLGDLDLATHLIRTRMLDAGYRLTDVTAALCDRWRGPARILPVSDDRIETHVVVEIDGERRALHFQEWWLRHGAALPALELVHVGIDEASASPDVLDAIDACDAVIIAPSNPVVSVRPVVDVDGVRSALAQRPVIGVSPLIGGAPVRGHADACLRAIGVESRADAVAVHYGARSVGGLLDAWLIDPQDADAADAISAAGIAPVVAPLLMGDRAGAARLAGDALAAVDAALA